MCMPPSSITCRAAAISRIAAAPDSAGLSRIMSTSSELDVTISIIAVTSMLLPFKRSEKSAELRLGCCFHKNATSIQ
ncbi:hypothetical protein Hanom_Chr02g00116621 [Helianthus anomalus]